MLNRREIMMALGAGVLTPRAAPAQTTRKVWRIGYLTSIPPTVYEPRLDAFKAGMTALGYADGRDYLIEIRASGIDPTRLLALAAELVALKVELILTAGTPTVLAASRATRTIPIVMTTAGDPMGIGVATSLARPGGNVTGMTGISTELSPKLLDLLRQVVPGLRRVGIVYDPNNPIDMLTLPRFEAGCATLKLEAIRAPASAAEDFTAAFQMLSQKKTQGVYVPGSGSNVTAHREIVALAARHRLPTIYGSAATEVNSGALMSYGADPADLYRQAAAYADRIFKGARPADLPIQQPTLFEFSVNLKTAKALGLKVPQSILIQATKVIE